MLWSPNLGECSLCDCSKVKRFTGSTPTDQSTDSNNAMEFLSGKLACNINGHLWVNLPSVSEWTGQTNTSRLFACFILTWKNRKHIHVKVSGKNKMKRPVPSTWITVLFNSYTPARPIGWLTVSLYWPLDITPSPIALVLSPILPVLCISSHVI